MSDPLSLAAGVVGILTAAAQISTLLIRFTNASRNAPAQARYVLTEVTDINGILSHLQSFLLGTQSANRSRTSLLKVDHTVTILSGCVMTFSELEKILDGLETKDVRVLDSMKWARKETEIIAITQRLQNHKASLSLMLNILNGNTLVEAKDSVDRLHDIVDRCYQEISARLQALELRELQRMSLAASVLENIELVSSNDLLEERLQGLNPNIVLNPEDDTFVPEFLDELKRSWVYRRNSAFRLSTYSSDRHSTTWSCLSSLSLSEVSNISVFNLAVTVEDVNNRQRMSQTWTNDFEILMQRSVPRSLVSGLIAQSTQHGSPDRILPKPDDGTSSIVTVTETPGTLVTEPPREEPSTPTFAAFTGSKSLPDEEPLIHPRENSYEGDYSCKGCGKILEEGKAFELAGSRWHIDCFRCKTCGTLIDSDSNLLLMGDGSIICNNCTYYCSSCDRKIEDITILAGDQAFCASCFKCRNCKRTIENLKYARTSQGNFCISCHESLMARRKKKMGKKKEPECVRATETDKSLPALPLSSGYF